MKLKQVLRTVMFAVLLAFAPLCLLAQGAVSPSTAPSPSTSLGFFVIIGVLATFVEGTVEYLFGKIEKIQPFIMYIALGLGVAVCIAYKIDILAQLGVSSGVPFVGEAISGLIVGRGSNYANDFITHIRGETPTGAPVTAKK